MIHLDTQITDRIPEAADRPPASAELSRRLENMRASATAATPKSSAITFRMLGRPDRRAVRRLAQRDSASAPDGRLLAAEAGDTLLAVISLDSGATIADPFRASADAVELLQLRARQLAGTGPRRGHRIRLPRFPRARGALAGSPPGGKHLLQL